MLFWSSLVAQPLEHLPVMQETQETWVWSLGQEEPLEEEMANSFQYFRLENTTDSKLASLQSMRSQRVRHDWSDRAHMCTDSLLPLCTWRGGLVVIPNLPGEKWALVPGPRPCLASILEGSSPLPPAAHSSQVSRWYNSFIWPTQLGESSFFNLCTSNLCTHLTFGGLWGHGYTCCPRKLASMDATSVCGGVLRSVIQQRCLI